jgi:dTDP-4-amino-4,6-dideoxygalactose transaminase
VNVPFVDLKMQHQHLQKEINQAINHILEKASFILGQDVTLFEQAFA